jgi:septum formation protein
MQPTLFLASTSPRRRKLISLLGISSYEIISTDIDEVINPQLSPDENATLLAYRKAEHAILSNHISTRHGVAVGADTIVVLDGRILGKPIDRDDAVRMLGTLSGKTHTVITGVSLVDTFNGNHRTYAESTNVTFRELTIDEIEQYVASGTPMDKAGSYGIQDDHGAVFVSRIEGDYYNVVGLPVCSLYVALRSFCPDLFL